MTGKKSTAVTTSRTAWGCKTHGHLVTTYLHGVSGVRCGCGKAATAGR